MRSLGLGVCGLTLVFVLLIVAARAIGNAQPPPEALQELHLTDCKLPCWLGIIPGKTTYEEAVRRMRVYYPYIYDPPGAQTVRALIYQPDLSDVDIETYQDAHGIVSQIFITTPNVSDGIALGDVTSLLGAPTCRATAVADRGLIFGSSLRNFAWIYPYGSVLTNWHAEVWNIRIFSDLNPCFVSDVSGERHRSSFERSG